MTTSCNVTVVNKIDLPGVDASHFIFFQEPVNLEPNADVLVWRTLNIQAGGKGKFPIALDTEYTATVTHGGDSTETSKAILAKHGDFLVVKKDADSDAPMLDLKTDSPDGSTNYVTVENEYEGNKQILIQAQKNTKPFIQQTMIVLNDHVQFQIGSFIFIAWNCELKQGDTFKSGTYSNSSKKINLIDPITHLFAKNIVVTVSNKGNAIEVTISYPSRYFNYHH